MDITKEIEIPEIKPEDQRSLVSIIAANKKGMLSKFTTFFAENNMNIERLSLSAADAENLIHRTVAYITGDRSRIDGLCKEMEKIENVYKVVNFVAAGGEYIEKELSMIKINNNNPMLSEVYNLVAEYKGKTIFSEKGVMIFQVESEEEVINEFMLKVKALTPDIEILRTGVIAVTFDKIIPEQPIAK